MPDFQEWDILFLIMSQKNTQILKEISQLISSVEYSSIQKTDKLKIIKVLLAIKLKLIWLLEKDLKKEAKMVYQASVAKSDMADNGRNNSKISDKHELILQFIKNKSGKVSYPELSDLGIAGRSLRRYIKNLSVSGKISVEKKGREYFYTLV